MGSDLKFGLRMLLKSRTATLLALLALGLGIGANTAVFSVADGMLLHPLPFHDSDRLAVINAVEPDGSSLTSISPADFYDWQQQQSSFADLEPWEWYSGNLTGQGASVAVTGARVAPGYFRMLGVVPLLGRTFAPDEGLPGHDRVLLLGKALWQKRFAASAAIVGQSVELDGQAETVIGVMNSDAVEPSGAGFWLPLALDGPTRASRTNHLVHTWGLLRPGATVSGAQAEFSALAQRAAAEYPASDRGWGVRVRSLRDWAIGNETQNYLLMLLGSTAFVLLIACANVANLQFARGLGRQHELAIRAALGAGRGQLLRQLLTESLLLGLGGALLGLVFAWWWVHLILAYMPADVAQNVAGWNQIHIHGRALLYTLVAGLAAALLSGLAPALSASRPDLNASLHEGGRGASLGRGRRRLRSALVVAQLALALTLLIGAGLMVRGFDAVQRDGRRYAPATLLSGDVSLSNLAAYQSPAARAAFYMRVERQLAALPGVEAVAEATMLPLSNNEDTETFAIEGQPVNADHPRACLVQPVSAGFFAAVHVPLLQGRLFDGSDGINSTPVAVVSRQFAHAYLPAGSPLGQHIAIGSDSAGNGWMTVVGVVDDVPYDAQSRAPSAVVYRLVAQSPPTGLALLLRAPGDVYRYTGGMRQAVAAVDSTLALGDPKTLAQIVHENNLGLSYVAVMMTVAGLIALALAVVGVYAVMAFAVGKRTREFGIRMAMGARSGQVLALVLRGGALLLALGVVLGLPLAFLLARVLASLLYGISPADVPTYFATTLVLAAAGALACYVPALRAARVDPLQALREN